LAFARISLQQLIGGCSGRALTLVVQGTALVANLAKTTFKILSAMYSSNVDTI
jgi:hypothetical protein